MEASIEKLIQTTKELQRRLEKCEGILMERDKAIFDLQKQNRQQENEIIKTQQMQLQDQQTQHDLKQLEVKVGNLSLKNIILEQKVDSVANQITNLKQHQKEQEDQRTANNETRRTKLDEGGDLGMLGAHELVTWKDTVSHQYKLMDSLSSQLKSLDNRVQHMNTENSRTVRHISNLENVLFSRGSEALCLEWRVEEVTELMKRAQNVLSPLFYIQHYGYRFQLKLRWSHQRYEKYGQDIGDINIDDHNMDENNRNKSSDNNNSSNYNHNNDDNNNDKDNENNNSNNANGIHIGLFLLLHRGDAMKKLKPFNLPYTFILEDKGGKKLSQSVTLVDIMFNRSRHTITPGDTTSQWHGFPKFLDCSHLDEYLVGDSLVVRCQFGS